MTVRLPHASPAFRLITLGAGRTSRFLRTRPRWMLAQRWVMGGTLASIAVKMVR